jgi:signal transduction histidine kinase
MGMRRSLLRRSPHSSVSGKKSAPGFTLAEGLGWLAVHAFWSVLLAAAGEAPSGVFLFGVRALLLYLCWVFFFARLAHRKPILQAGVQLLSGVAFAVGVAALLNLWEAAAGQAPFRAVTAGPSFFASLLLYYAHAVLFHACRFRRAAGAPVPPANSSELDVLNTRIDRHFLFNSLNAISASIPPELEDTRVLVARLADTFRYALRVSEQPLVSLEEDLAFIRNWLALEQQRFGPRLSVQYRVDPAALEVPVPPMLLQPLVENALYHGIAPSPQGGTVTIECRVEAGARLCIAVRDTGAGYAGDLEQLFHKGTGLRTTARRLKLLCRQPIRVERQEKGLLFFFHLPLNNGLCSGAY